MNGKLTSPEKEKSDFKVIIAGGGITGLTLANSLERAPISYILLEARKISLQRLALQLEYCRMDAGFLL
jgi:2-polyprenyl-6-methoxyphenol hydroxylase-like FAD-dependent oxidoreductase